MVTLREIVEELDRELRIAELPDYPGAVNGLQMEGPDCVSKVVAAVDATEPVIAEAVARGADLLLVHHGLFWGGVQTFTGAWYRKIRQALGAELAIYSAHLPLDVHPRLGNNACLARAIDMDIDGTFLAFQGMPIGIVGRWHGSRDQLRQKLEEVLGGAVHVAPGGSGRIERIGLCTGGAGAQVAEAAAVGVDAMITGEGPHHSYGLAEEHGVDLFYGGHYATETQGVRALAQELAERYALAWEFIDHPSGL